MLSSPFTISILRIHIWSQNIAEKGRRLFASSLEAQLVGIKHELNPVFPIRQNWFNYVWEFSK